MLRATVVCAGKTTVVVVYKRERAVPPVCKAVLIHYCRLGKDATLLGCKLTLGAVGTAGRQLQDIRESAGALMVLSAGDAAPIVVLHYELLAMWILFLKSKACNQRHASRVLMLVHARLRRLVHLDQDLHKAAVRQVPTLHED